MTDKLTFGQLLMQMHAAAMKDPAIVNIPVTFHADEVDMYYAVDRVDIAETINQFGHSIIQLQPVNVDGWYSGTAYYAPAFTGGDRNDD